MRGVEPALRMRRSNSKCGAKKSQKDNRSQGREAPQHALDQLIEEFELKAEATNDAERHLGLSLAPYVQSNQMKLAPLDSFMQQSFVRRESERAGQVSKNTRLQSIVRAQSNSSDLRQRQQDVNQHFRDLYRDMAQPSLVMDPSSSLRPRNQPSRLALNQLGSLLIPNQPSRMASLINAKPVDLIQPVNVNLQHTLSPTKPVAGAQQQPIIAVPQVKVQKQASGEDKAAMRTSDISVFQPEEEQKTTGAAAKRSAKAATKKGRRVSRAAQQAESKPYDPNVITNAVADYERRDPEQPRRGRKPVREDIYISESLAKIKEMEQRMIDEKDTLTTKEREELRNKASALRSRVNRKLEHRTFMRDLDIAKTQFEKLSKVITDELDVEARERITRKLASMAPAQDAPASKKTGAKTAKAAQSKSGKSTKADFIGSMKQFIGFD